MLWLNSSISIRYHCQFPHFHTVEFSHLNLGEPGWCHQGIPIKRRQKPNILPAAMTKNSASLLNFSEKLLLCMTSYTMRPLRDISEMEGRDDYGFY
jgi:hypothetical protein